MQRLLRSRTLESLRFDGSYLVALDGVHFATYNKPHCKYCLRKTKDGKTIYFHYALVAMIVSESGMVFPVAVEFIENTAENGKPLDFDDEFKKQDCELKAFYRMAEKIRKMFPRLRICLLLDALYCNQNVIKICQDNFWDFFISMQDDSTPALQRKFNADMSKHPENSTTRNIDGFRHTYSWSNLTRHQFSAGKNAKEYALFKTSLASEADNGDQRGKVKFEHVTNSKPTRNNIEILINTGARQRWKIENQGFNNLKNLGMELEHGFGTTGNSLYNYFLLRMIAFIIQTLEINSNMFRKLQAHATNADIIIKPPMKFFKTFRGLAKQLLHSLKMEHIAIPDISNWRVSLNSS